jgi:hypothetical protein
MGFLPGVRWSGPDEAGDRLGGLADLLVGLAAAGLSGLDDAVRQVLLDQAEATDCSAFVIAETWVRMSMQYFSSSTIRCSPRACPSMRRSRLR